MSRYRIHIDHYYGMYLNMYRHNSRSRSRVGAGAGGRSRRLSVGYYTSQVNVLLIQVGQTPGVGVLFYL
jgi:hypothetical protein